jgi:DNA-binding CsgD family transcriptional regulator
MKQKDEEITLTPSEKETLLLICSNLKQQEVADKRGLDFETIQSQCKIIRAKLYANSMAVAVFRAMALGIITKDETDRIMDTDWQGLK